MPARSFLRPASQVVSHTSMVGDLDGVAEVEQPANLGRGGQRLAALEDQLDQVADLGQVGRLAIFGDGEGVPDLAEDGFGLGLEAPP